MIYGISKDLIKDVISMIELIKNNDVENIE